MSGPVDDALALQALGQAAEDYALQHGVPGTAGYRAAWLKFRQHIKTTEDLRRWQSGIAAKRRKQQALRQRTAARLKPAMPSAPEPATARRQHQPVVSDVSRRSAQKKRAAA